MDTRGFDRVAVSRLRGEGVEGVTRRDSLVLLVGAGFAGSWQTTGSGVFDLGAPRDLIWNLGSLRNFIVERNGERVVISVDEVWRALTAGTPAPSQEGQ